MANSRDYAKGLVGELNRTIYNTQRDVAQRTHQTNWQNLQNQYKNLTEELKTTQEEANKNYANTVANVAGEGFDRMRGYNTDLVNRGVAQSGTRDLAQQANIEQKGKDVLDALAKQGNISVDIANRLADANKTALQKESDLAKGIADTLGDIGAGETAAQMDYNAALADIAESKDARDDNNDLQRRQRAAQAAANSGGGTEDYDKALDEIYRRQAILAVLQGVNPETGEELDYDDNQKANTLKILYGVENPNNVIKSYNNNKKSTKSYNKKVKSYEDKISNPQKYNKEEYKKAMNKMSDEAKYVSKIIERPQHTGGGNEVIVKRYLQGDPSVSRDQAKKALKAIDKDLDFKEVERLNKSYNDGTFKTMNQIQYNYSTKPYVDKQKQELAELKSKGITYDDLARMLYGNSY